MCKRWGEILELQILDWLNSLHNPVMDCVMIGITSLGNAGIFWIIVALCLLPGRKTRSWGLTMLCAMALGFLVVNLGVKPLVNRIRPYEAAGFTQLLIEKPKDASFPSGHTQVSFASAWVLYRMNRRAGIWALILAGLIALSRLYLYVHYPSDVLVGFLFGGLWAYISLRYVRPWVCKKWKLD